MISGGRVIRDNPRQFNSTFNQLRFRQEIDRLDHKIKLEVGKLNHEIGGLKEGQQRLDRRIVESQVKITQWVVGLFIGTAVTMATLTGVYINAILLMW